MKMSFLIIDNSFPGLLLSYNLLANSEVQSCDWGESRAEALVLVLRGVGVTVVSLVSDTTGDFGEAGFDSLSDGAEELELVLSGLGGGGVLLVDGSAERIRVVEESLVAVSLGGGGVDDAGLGDNAFLESVELVLQTFLLADQVLDGALESALVGVVVGD